MLLLLSTIGTGGEVNTFCCCAVMKGNRKCSFCVVGGEDQLVSCYLVGGEVEFM